MKKLRNTREARVAMLRIASIGVSWEKEDLENQVLEAFQERLNQYLEKHYCGNGLRHTSPYTKKTMRKFEFSHQ